MKKKKKLQIYFIKSKSISRQLVQFSKLWLWPDYDDSPLFWPLSWSDRGNLLKIGNLCEKVNIFPRWQTTVWYFHKVQTDEGSGFSLAVFAWEMERETLWEGVCDLMFEN